MLFTEYVRFAYERLGDVKEWVGQDWYMWSTDDTSGYHHIPMAESAWKYLAFELGGRLMCFTHLPFGLKDACRVFTQVKQEIYRPLRGAGMLLNFLIDDVMGGAATLPAAVFQCWVVVRLLVLLGFYLGIDKS